MDQESSKVFDIYERLFAEEGWKDIVEDFKERRARLTNSLIVDQKAGEKELYTAQGMCRVYSYIIDLEGMMESSKASMVSEVLPEHAYQ